MLLNELNVGEEAVVKNMIAENRRLSDLGLVEGTRVKCIFRSPLGDPVAYKIKGALVAIRSEDARNVALEVGEYE